MLWNAISRLHSVVVCHGDHVWREKTIFDIDLNGPEIFTGFPPTGIPFGNIGPLDRGRYETFTYCRRCGLRQDGSGYEIW